MTRISIRVIVSMVHSASDRGATVGSCSYFSSPSTTGGRTFDCLALLGHGKRQYVTVFSSCMFFDVNKNDKNIPLRWATWLKLLERDATFCVQLCKGGVASRDATSATSCAQMCKGGVACVMDISIFSRS